MTVTTSVQDSAHSTWPVTLASAIRAAFGVIWAINAYLIWQPDFAAHFVGYFQNAAQVQPSWLQPWFALWLALVTPAAGVFVWLTRVLETVIAIGLLLGLARKWTYLIGGAFSLLLWSTVDGFGGPYVVEARNPGPALVYVLVFVALALFDRIQGITPYSVDYYLGRRWPAWKRFAEWAPRHRLGQTPPHLSWPQQGAAIAGIIVALIFLLGSLQSALNAPPTTPANAAAAVSPLSLASSTPITATRDATLPPLLGAGNAVSVTLTATDTTVEIANGVNYQAWTFGGTVPAPVLHVRQGQTVNITFINQGTMPHSIDFHAAEVPPDVAYRDINPGETLQFSFIARTPGVFVYHCGTPPVLVHIGNGMYGAIIVDPTQSLPPADMSYVLVQSEWYTRQVKGNLMAGDTAKMIAITPDEVVFNGVAFQYRDRPLTAKAGQRVRLYVVNAGPNLPSAFHVIGAIFDAVYPDGDPAHALTGVSTYTVAPGQGVVFDLIIPQAGKYPFVDHSMRNMLIGAVGVLDVAPAETESLSMRSR